MQQLLSTLGAASLVAGVLWLVIGSDTSSPAPDQHVIDAVDPTARATAQTYGQLARMMELQGACLAAEPAAKACDDLATLQREMAASAVEEPSPLDTSLPATGPATDLPVVQEEDTE